MGRFTVSAVIGKGGHAWVVRAFDPRLGRQVALKLMASSDDARRDVWLAEARALASIEHPNIVPVHEAGEHAGFVYVVMQLVEGVDFRQWLQRTGSSPPEREIRRILAEAGRGLRAAHDAGWVHGDFKPGNVLVGFDGRVRVADFGLARSLSDGLSDRDEPDDGPEPAGTPAYLAPERYDGAAPSVASDVFAFCATAWEALFGGLPWPPETEASLLAKRRGAPAFTGPRRLRHLARVLQRGLAPSPGERPPTLGPVLEALQPVEVRSRRRWLVGGFALVVATAWWLLEPPDACDDPGRALLATEARDDARRGLLRASPSAGAQLWARIEPRLQRYADRWSEAHATVCRSGRSDDPRTRAALACLQAHAARVDVLLDALAHADASTLERGERAFERLEPVDACLGDPPDSTSAERLAEVAMLEGLGRYDAAFVLAEHIAAPLAPDSRDHLEARYWTARLLERIGDAHAADRALYDVYATATSTGAHDIAARAAVYRAYVLAGVLHRPDEALQWLPRARAAVERAGDDPELGGNLIEQHGTARLYVGDFEGAATQYRAALKVYTELGNDRLRLSALSNLGIALEEAERYDDAIEIQREALDAARRHYGDWHPYVGRCLDNLGTVEQRRGELDRALAHYDASLEIRRAFHGPDHPLVALSLHHRAVASLLAGDPERALIDLRTAMSIYDDKLQPDDLGRLQVIEAMAHATHAVGDVAQARGHARAALGGLRERFAPEHPEIRALEALLVDG